MLAESVNRGSIDSEDCALIDHVQTPKKQGGIFNLRNVVIGLIVLFTSGAIAITIMLGINSGPISDSQNQLNGVTVTFANLTQQKTGQDLEI